MLFAFSRGYVYLYYSRIYIETDDGSNVMEFFYLKLRYYSSNLFGRDLYILLEKERKRAVEKFFEKKMIPINMENI